MYALDGRYGKLIWHYETGDKVPGAPIVKDGVVYAGLCDHNVYALEVNLWCGGERDQARPDKCNWSPPSPASHVL